MMFVLFGLILAAIFIEFFGQFFLIILGSPTTRDKRSLCGFGIGIVVVFVLFCTICAISLSTPDTTTVEDSPPAIQLPHKPKSVLFSTYTCFGELVIYESATAKQPIDNSQVKVDGKSVTITKSP